MKDLLDIKGAPRHLPMRPPEIWFVTGSQHLYGPGPLKTGRGQLAGDRRRALGQAGGSPCRSSSSPS
jgi:hypothetical protein